MAAGRTTPGPADGPVEPVEPHGPVEPVEPEGHVAAGALARLAALHGVATSYAPSADRTVQVPDATVVAVLAALGVEGASPEAIDGALARCDSAAGAALLPPTVVLWRDATALPDALAALPSGTRVRVSTEQGGVEEWSLRGPGGVPGTGAGPGPGGSEVHGSAEGPPPCPPSPKLSASLEQGGAPAPPGGGPAAQGGGGNGDMSLWGQLPVGVHRVGVRLADGRVGEGWLVVAPGRVRAPHGPRHGFLVQLYSLLSARSWGMGDLGDLRELAGWAGRSFGAGFVQVNPLHAAVPGTPTDPSPYRPSSRRFPDPVHLRIEDVPEYGYVTGAASRARLAELSRGAAALRADVLHKGALIDRDAVWDLKKQALEILAAVPLGPGRRAAYCDFLAEQGRALEDHATWCALAELHGPDRGSWPGGLADRDSTDTARARTALRDRIDFHSRLAWLTDEQLAAAQREARAAGMTVGLVHDLAVGVHPEGADTWAQPHAFARRMSIGAPPDAFNARGQDWGLPPWRPDALAASGYAPYRSLLRGILRHGGALRIDHVMGLFRLWWVPEGHAPADGTYVRYDAEAMLAVLVLEAHRAGAVVVGEDLGTVEPGVRDALAARGVLGTSVLWFERDWTGTGRPLPPGSWREGCVATATTHDLPSTAARLTGDHVALRHRLGLLTRPLEQEREQDAAEVTEWLTYLAGLGLLPEGVGGGHEEAAVRAVYRFLLRTGARMVGVWLPDTVGDRRPQNLPGTWDQYPNWRLPLADPRGRPLTLEELATSPRLHTLMEMIRQEAGTAPGGGPGAAPGPLTAPPGARPA